MITKLNKQGKMLTHSTFVLRSMIIASGNYAIASLYKTNVF